MPYDYNYHDSEDIDPFAQTASTDDLFFDDDFIPIPEPVIEPNPVEVPNHDPIPDAAPRPSGMSQSQYSHNPPRGPANGERGGRGRGRGRGGGRGRGRGAHQNAEPRESKADAPQPSGKEPETEAAAPSPAPEDAPTTPSAPKEPRPTHSARGDRTLTGGPARSRLTDAELSAKLASMREKNESLAAAHARAEADIANFEAREAEAAQASAARKKQLAERQKADRQNRQQMMGERERNRQRKLDSLKGREWDNEKEDGFSGTGEEKRRGVARGAHGGVVPSPRPAAASSGEGGWGDAQLADEASIPTHRGGRGRGRGPRGPRSTRGDHHHTPHSHSHSHPHQIPKSPTTQAPPTPADFPELPASTITTAAAPTDAPLKLDFPISIKGKAAEIKTAAAEDKDKDKDKDSSSGNNNGGSGEKPALSKADSFGLPSPMGPGRSWADQVEGS
ncbi:hypothetical protein BDV95DRAFT_575305 [Massariosphaeria phaeospora]|uniref:Uncharacterized protein n=1 Tax=Massariosphaeria phaeospora TaxID=100035 RepID=A0A7C8I8V4_9PLEO|nr:hypothetical protein BDV95DRAFT_575305 [Massariosphaeria phaeospora]